MGPGATGHMDRPPSTTMVKDVGTAITTAAGESFDIKEGDPNSSVWRQHNSTRWKRGDWDCTVAAAYELTSTPDDFHITERLTAKKGDEEIFRQETTSTVKRDLI